jgi:catechol 2,3-dioxygenase-like lactoylglutathione lyase family enzyme
VTATPRAAHLVIDVTDLDRAAAFWSALLEAPLAQREAEWDDLAPLGTGGHVLSFQLVAEPKVGKNRLHLDFAVAAAAGGAAAAGRRARELGATPASQLFSTGATAPWQVWRDPDGNEFCLTTDAGAAAPDSPAADR